MGGWKRSVQFPCVFVPNRDCYIILPRYGERSRLWWAAWHSLSRGDDAVALEHLKRLREQGEQNDGEEEGEQDDEIFEVATVPATLSATLLHQVGTQGQVKPSDLVVCVTQYPSTTK